MLKKVSLVISAAVVMALTSGVFFKAANATPSELPGRAFIEHSPHLLYSQKEHSGAPGQSRKLDKPRPDDTMGLGSLDDEFEDYPAHRPPPGKKQGAFHDRKEKLKQELMALPPEEREKRMEELRREFAEKKEQAKERRVQKFNERWSGASEAEREVFCSKAAHKCSEIVSHACELALKACGT
jgi:hypothetical protein